jgi:hypothetical protein
LGADPNTQTLKQVWFEEYQLTHYKQPVFRAITEEKMVEGKLRKGDTINWSYKSDFYVNDMGADGSYSTQAQTDTNETLVINKVKEVSFYEFEKDLEQSQYPVKVAYAQKAMNKVFLQVDADVLLAAYQGATSTIKASDFGGSAVGVALSSVGANIPQIFSTAVLKLQQQNVIYDPNLTFTKDVKLERVVGMPVALISPQTYQALIVFLGGKTTVLGDKVSVSGHAGAYMGFNLFVSNTLPWSGQLTVATTPTNLDTITINGMVFTLVTSATNPGEITISGTSQTIIKTALNAPFTSVSGYVAQTDNAANRLKLANIVCPTFSSNVATITQAGIGNAIVSTSFTSANNFWTTGLQIQHNLFGVSRSVALVIQKYPELYVNPVSGKVGKDYVTWCYYGIKVFTYQAPQLVDCWIDASGFTSQPSTLAN